MSKEKKKIKSKTDQYNTLKDSIDKILKCKNINKSSKIKIN